MCNFLLFFIFYIGSKYYFINYIIKVQIKIISWFYKWFFDENNNNEKIKIIDIKDNINNSVLLKENEEYKNKINELEKNIKELEIKLIEKDKLIADLNKKIKELENISNNKIKTDNIIELENEIKLFRIYYKLSDNEKLISIKFISVNQDIDFSIIAKNTDVFSKIEKMLYDKYPKYIESENYFLMNGNKINKHKTLEQNKIKNNDILALQINNFDWWINIYNKLKNK